MERKEFKVQINAPREKVWNTLWDNDTYQEWTSVFSEGSRAETDWKKGSKVLFTDGTGNGMVSTIADNRPNEYMSIKHLGMLKDGVEDTESEEVKPWAGAFENYSLQSVNGGTEVAVELDVNDQFKDYFMETFPKALQKLKEVAERN
jgi:uncharacterized protein YndB with AHSA1/START domain